MGIKESGIKLLVVLADYGKGPDDPDRGRYEFGGAELPELTNLKINDINDAAEYLEKLGCVKLDKYMGTHPYAFGHISLTPHGRMEAEKFSGQPQAHEIDPLLQLFNRGCLDSDLPNLAGQCKAAGLPLAVIMIDLDHFKTFNDNYGHAAGDLVLTSTASSLRNVVGAKGKCYRYGGEELFVILPNYTKEEILPLAERIRLAISSIKLEGLPPVSASLGVAISECSGYDAKELCSEGDKALYAAKDAGRNIAKFAWDL
jgi:diguanylate cyclase (GGDEF)-like protein